MAAEGGELLLALVVVLAGAKIGGELFRRIGQPPLIGEILVGVLLGPSLLGVLPEFSADAPSVNAEILLALATIGVLLLLFEVGLETDIDAFRRVGLSAGIVGFLGVAISLVAGFVVSYLLVGRIPWIITEAARSEPNYLHVFVGAALTATSVGITARVLRELGKIRSPESQIILGAAVFDDVLGLIVLAIVSGLITGGGTLDPLEVAKVFVFSLGFFVLAIALGSWLAPRFMRLVHRFFKADYVHLGFAVLFMFLVSWLATLAGLAAIVGAFAAGLALSRSEHRHVIFEHVKPVASLFVSFFFVVLGARIDLREVAGDTATHVLIAGLVLTVVGVIAKLGAGLGVVRAKASRYIVGIGMVPRGEVGLIFAVFGLEYGLVTNWQYTSIVLVVLLTTLLTPVWLKALEKRFGEDTTQAPPSEARVAQVMEP